MKEKLKRFFLEKRELLVFLGVLAVIFTTVITVVTLALKDSQQAGGELTESSDAGGEIIPSSKEPIISSDSDANASGDDSITDVTISLPVSGDYVIVRDYFDKSKTKEELETAIIYNGSTYEESKGISYAKADNKSFEVNAIYPGTVKEVVYDEINGYTVTITHEENLVSIYMSLSECNVEKNDTVSTTTILGMSGSRVYDESAGVHVHVQVKLNDIYLDPASLIGKQIDEVSSVK